MCSKENKTYIFNPGERLDIGTVDSLSLDINRIMKKDTYSKILIDMRFVQVCDIYGVNFLSECCRILEEKDKECRILEPLPLIREILTKSGFNRLDLII